MTYQPHQSEDLSLKPVAARPLTSDELADCCGGCRSNSAIETWMRRAIERFCAVNGIPLDADGVGEVPRG